MRRHASAHGGRYLAAVGTIRALDRDDIPAVARLVEQGFPDAPPAAEGMEAFLTDVALDHPWFEPELPSLVGLDDDGRVVGFMACHARRLRLGERTVRAACCSHLVVDPSLPPSALGPRILARFMSGPQELSYSDTAIDVISRMWRAAGGEVDHTRSLVWTRTLRPQAWAGRILAGRLGPRRLASGLAPVRPLPMTLARPPAEERLDTVPLTPEALVANTDAVAGWLPVRTAWDEPFARWLLAAVERRVGRGRLVARVVSRGPTVVGWYVYAQGPAGQGLVLQVGARRREVDAVVGELFAGARDDGMIVLTGRLEPHLLEALRVRGCAVGFGDRSVLHSRDERLLGEIRGSGALLSRLDGEWW